MHLLSLPFLLLWVFGLGSALSGTAYALGRLAKRRRARKPSAPLPAITILKPLKGADADLERNLRTFFEQDYPSFELIFCVAEAHDPALAVISRLLEQYPRVRARLHVGAAGTEVNPKIDNLLPGYALARHDLILISDSNVRVPTDHLEELALKMDEGVGVVTAVVVGVDGKGLGGRLESMFLNTFHARWMQILYGLGHPCVVGKTMLFRRAAMERFGGLKCLGPFLAEDYMAGIIMKRLGLRTELIATPVPQPIGRIPVRAFWSRHLRWGRLRRAQLPPAYWAEPFQSAVGSGICLAIAATILGWSVVPWLLGHALLWCLADLTLLATLGQKIGPATLPIWVLRELSSLPYWVHVGVSKTVNWKGHALVLRPGGLLQAC